MAGSIRVRFEDGTEFDIPMGDIHNSQADPEAISFVYGEAVRKVVLRKMKGEI